MEQKIVICAFFIQMIFFGIGCVEIKFIPGEDDLQEPGYIQETEDNQTTHYSPEMEKLIDFLNQDLTDKKSFYDDPHRGVSYNVCTGFSRELARNAKEYGIFMGTISLRDTMKVGAGTRYFHAMNYCIIDGKFIMIEPQTDEIFTLESLKNSDYSVYKYISIYQDAETMTNFGRGRLTVDIDIYGNYDENEIVKKFPPK